MDPNVADWLLRCGIARVVVGHKPTGDCPAVLSSLYTGVEIVSADTSFSDTAATDNRGSAICIVELVGSSPTDNQLHLRGTLRNGVPYNCQFHRLHSKNQIDNQVGDPYLGRQVTLIDDDETDNEDWWVKVRANDGSYWLTKGNGRHVKYKQVAKTVIE